MHLCSFDDVILKRKPTLTLHLLSYALLRSTTVPATKRQVQPLIGASILAADMCNIGQEIEDAIHASADWCHVDIVDNSFAPVSDIHYYTLDIAALISVLFICIMCKQRLMIKCV
jgi:Ribulose-phosphate 3 epimerase family